jgi:hypothetical protein
MPPSVHWLLPRKNLIAADYTPVRWRGGAFGIAQGKLRPSLPDLFCLALASGERIPHPSFNGFEMTSWGVRCSIGSFGSALLFQRTSPEGEEVKIPALAQAAYLLVELSQGLFEDLAVARVLRGAELS